MNSYLRKNQVLKKSGYLIKFTLSNIFNKVTYSSLKVWASDWETGRIRHSATFWRLLSDKKRDKDLNVKDPAGHS